MIRFVNGLLTLLSACLVSGCANEFSYHPVQDAQNDSYHAIKAFAEDDWSEAKRLFSQSLSAYESIDDQSAILHSHINLAEVSLAQHDSQQTKHHLTLASLIAKQENLQSYQSRITLLTAQNVLRQKDVMQARELLTPLLPEFEKGLPLITPEAIQVAALISRVKIAVIQNQDLQLWTSRLAGVIENYPGKSLKLEARLLRFQAILKQQTGAHRQAEADLRQALVYYKKNLSRSGIAATLMELAQLSIEQKQLREAEVYLNRSLAIYQYLGITDKQSIIKKRLQWVQKSVSD